MDDDDDQVGVVAAEPLVVVFEDDDDEPSGQSSGRGGRRAQRSAGGGSSSRQKMDRDPDPAGDYHDHNDEGGGGNTFDVIFDIDDASHVDKEQLVHDLLSRYVTSGATIQSLVDAVARKVGGKQQSPASEHVEEKTNSCGTYDRTAAELDMIYECLGTLDAMFGGGGGHRSQRQTQTTSDDDDNDDNDNNDDDNDDNDDAAAAPPRTARNGDDIAQELVAMIDADKFGWNSDFYEEDRETQMDDIKFSTCPGELVDGVEQCRRCKSWQVFMFQLQTRGADEGMTTFARCANCKSSWIAS
jgi:DNA-directed RNA polymerase subunit M/transcription elongation factor TFIIS